VDLERFGYTLLRVAAIRLIGAREFAYNGSPAQHEIERSST
jgi:hypothetical protein